MSGVTWAGASVCPSRKRMVKHKPHGEYGTGGLVAQGGLTIEEGDQ